MSNKIDYDNLRKTMGFDGSVSVSQSFLIDAAGITFRDFYLQPEACIEAYRKGIRILEAWFGTEVAVGIYTPAIRYGHVNCLGAELIFPEQGEVGLIPLYKSLDDALCALDSPLEAAATSSLFAFYQTFRETMIRAFPDKPIGFAFGFEGPVTTGWELRGEDFFLWICTTIPKK